MSENLPNKSQDVNQSHQVLELIRDRVANASQPGKRSDNFKLGLAIEGGGMRGVVSCGMASALHFLGATNAFDVVYGASAGAFNGSFFVTGKMPIGPTIFYQDINNSHFISLRRLLSKRPVMDLGFLIDHVLVNVKPLNWKGLIESPIPLKIVAASLNTGESSLLSDFSDRSELFTALRASATMPFVAGPPVPYKDDLLFDASLFEPLPYKSAIQDSCTHVMVLASRPKTRLRTAPSFLERLLIEKRLRSLSSKAADAFLHRAEDYSVAVRHIENSTNNPIAPPFIFGIQPAENALEVHQLERNRNALLNGTASGIDAVMRVFVPDEIIRCFEVLTPANTFGLIPKLKTSR